MKAFGAESANEITGDVARASAEQLAKVDAANADVQADTATVTVGPDVYHLHKVPGQGWKIAVGALLTEASPQVLDQVVREMNDRTIVAQATADEMLAGKYKSTDEVAQAFRGKMLQLQLERTSTTTTAPSDEAQPPEAPKP